MVDGEAVYIHRDQINSGGLITTNASTGSTGSPTSATAPVADRVAFDPYGTILYQQASTGSTTELEEKFTGQILDIETGLYYYNARYYDPVSGVFLSADSIMPDPYDSQSLNRYMYVSGNPVKYSDPTGHAQDGGNYGPGYGLAAMGYGYYGYGTHGISYGSWNGIMLYYGGGQLIGTGTLSGSYATAFHAGGGNYAGGVRGDAVGTMLLGSQQVSGNLGMHEGAIAKADAIMDSLMDPGYGRIPEPAPVIGRLANSELGQWVIRNSYKVLNYLFRIDYNKVLSLRVLDSNRMHHIFEKASHNLNALILRLGGVEQTVVTVSRHVQSLANKGVISGNYEVVVRVAGFNVTVRGSVCDGIAKIGTFFIRGVDTWRH